MIAKKPDEGCQCQGDIGVVPWLATKRNSVQSIDSLDKDSPVDLQVEHLYTMTPKAHCRPLCLNTSLSFAKGTTFSRILFTRRKRAPKLLLSLQIPLLSVSLMIMG